MTVRFLAEAEAELDGAIAYYTAQSPGLGAQFAIEIRDGLYRIEQYPLAWHLLGPRVRRYRLKRFPYGLVYAPLPTEIIVVALMHLHRRPDYWNQQMTEI